MDLQPFVVAERHQPRRSARETPHRRGNWEVFAPAECDFVYQLLETLNGAGVVLYLPSGADGGDVLLEACLAACNRQGGRFALVHHGHAGAAFVRAFAREQKELAVTIVELPDTFEPEADDAVQVEREILATESFNEARLTDDGQRLVPTLVPQDVFPEAWNGPKSGGVLLAAGGGKGLGALCTRAMAHEYGLQVAIFGRSDPRADSRLARNLAALRGDGLEVRYFRVDLGNRNEVEAILFDVELELGPVHALLYAAGSDRPRQVISLNDADLEAARESLAVGFQNVMAGLNTMTLDLLVGCGSAMARAGVPGLAAHGLAHEELRREIEATAERLGDTRVLHVEWSTFEGVGLGRRLTHIATFNQRLFPIAPEDGLIVLRQLLRSTTPVTVTVPGLKIHGNE